MLPSGQGHPSWPTGGLPKDVGAGPPGRLWAITTQTMGERYAFRPAPREATCLARYPAALAHFGKAAEKLDGLAPPMLAEMLAEGRGSKTDGRRGLLHYCIAGMLLPHGSNRDRTISQCDAFFVRYPDYREEFESDAAKYIADRV